MSHLGKIPTSVSATAVQAVLVHATRLGYLVSSATCDGRPLGLGSYQTATNLIGHGSIDLLFPA